MKQKLINLIEQPTGFLSVLKKIKPAAYFEILWASKVSKKKFNTYIDAGAHEGAFIKAFKSIFPTGKTFAIEPQKNLCEYIARKYKSVCFPVALWNKNQKNSIFYLNKNRSANSSLFQYDKNNIDKDNMEVKKVSIDKARFDSLPIKIVSPCLLKIDVEGAEYEALIGFGDRLKEIDAIIIEKHLQKAHKNITSFGKIFDLLEKYGFYGFIQKTIRYKNGYPSKCDLIFYKPKI